MIESFQCFDVGLSALLHVHFVRRARVMALSYDYTVLAGTQGASNHYKQDRMFPLAARLRLPVCIFTEGGGGRPGDTEGFLVFADHVNER